MRELVMIGIALAFTGILLVFRRLLFGRPAGGPYYVYRAKPHDGGNDPGSLEEWPSIIGAEEFTHSSVEECSDEERVELQPQPRGARNA